jgi:ABC-type glycerol-3-phosphate transport system permease component
MPLLRYLGNTLISCTGCVIETTLSCALIAYGLARIRWLERKYFFPLVIGSMLLSWHVTMIPRFVSSYGDQTNLLLAASVLFTLLIIVLFFSAQRAFIEGISTTGIKN